LDHLLKQHEAIPTYDLIRKCVGRITVNFDCLTIKFKPTNFVKLVEKHLRVSVTGCEGEFEITVPFRTKRSRNGAMVIRSQSGDVFDMPPENLKKLVQGHIWREDHFNGVLMIDIAKREGCSDTHVRKAIMCNGFDFI